MKHRTLPWLAAIAAAFFLGAGLEHWRLNAQQQSQMQALRDQVIQALTRVKTTEPVPSVEPLVIRIRSDGSYVVDGKVLDTGALAARLGAVASQNDQSAVIIRADVRGYIRPFDTVTAMCVTAGIDSARLVYMRDDGKPVAGP